MINSINQNNINFKSGENTSMYQYQPIQKESFVEHTDYTEYGNPYRKTNKAKLWTGGVGLALGAINLIRAIVSSDYRNIQKANLSFLGKNISDKAIIKNSIIGMVITTGFWTVIGTFMDNSKNNKRMEFADMEAFYKGNQYPAQQGYDQYNNQESY